MKKRTPIFFRIYAVIYFILLISIGAPYILENEGIVPLLLLPLMIPWCLLNKTRFLPILKREGYQDAVIRVMVSACIGIWLARQIETLFGSHVIAVCCVLPLIAIAYFLKLRQDLKIINRRAYTKFLLIFLAEIYAVYLVNVPITVNISVSSWRDIPDLSFIEIVKTVIFLAVCFPLLLYLNFAGKDQTLEGWKREAAKCLFWLLVLFYVLLLAVLLIFMFGAGRSRARLKTAFPV